MITADTLTDEFLTDLKASLAKQFVGCKTIAVKIHFGEEGNSTAFTPQQVKPFTDILKELGFDFFLFDTSVAYPGPRNNPKSHKELATQKGFDKLGPIRTEDEFVSVQGKHLAYEVAKPLGDADGILVLTHVKGHVCTGFGGAIKNLGMGGVSKGSKSAIHSGGEPKEEGVCYLCGACEEACPINGIKVGKQVRVNKCFGCSNCGYVCPTGYLQWKVAPFDNLLADAALACASTFKKSFYISVLNNVSRFCDCMRSGGKLISEDCGYLASDDLIAIDEMAHEVITQHAGEDVFLEENKKTGMEQVLAAKELLKENGLYKRRK